LAPGGKLAAGTGKSRLERKSLQPGDVIKVTFNPSRSGASVGRLIKLIKADGEELTRVGAE